MNVVQNPEQASHEDEAKVNLKVIFLYLPCALHAQ